MPGRIYTEAVKSHLYEAGITINKILRHSGMLSVQVNTVARNLPPPT